MDEISVRYIVDDVDTAVDFYTAHLGFEIRMRPGPGFQIEVADLDATVTRLRQSGANLRGEVITGKGGKQILLCDPAGNLIELFEPFPR